MIVSKIKNVDQIYLITERDFVVYFFKKVAKISNNILVVPMLPNVHIVSNILIILDSYIFEASSIAYLKDFEYSKYPILCLESNELSEKVRNYVEKVFKYIIPFPVMGDYFLNYFFDKIAQIQKDFFGSFCKKQEDENVCSLFSGKESEGEKSLLGYFVGESDAICSVRIKIKKLAKTDVPVLLIGETGTGKSTAASVIHKLSKRNKRKMQSLNVSTINDDIACSDFFGTTVGAFTDALNKDGFFKIADKSTLFFDEIGLASNELQSMLLTVIDTGTFNKVGCGFIEKTDVRLLFATNADLGEKMREGSFRNDFFSRISGNVISFPPLRSRKEDIPYIIKAYLKEKKLSDDAMDKLMNYDWPGNIRELHQCIYRAVMFASKDTIYADDIDFGVSF